MNSNNDNQNKSVDQASRQQILTLLNQLGDRLKSAEAEREGLREQIRDYREQIEDVEDRAATTEKVYLNIENRLNAYDRSEAELRQELQDKAEKLAQVETKIPDEAALEKRLTHQIPDTRELEERVKTAEQQAQQALEKAESYENVAGRLERRVEQLINDNTRMSRKLEQLDDDVARTDDALKSRAMVLLTDRQTAEQSGQGYLPAGGAYTHNLSNDASDTHLTKFTNLMQHPLPRTASIVVLVLLGAGGGWLMNNAVQTGNFIAGNNVQQAAQTTESGLENAGWPTMAQMNRPLRSTEQFADSGDSTISPEDAVAAEEKHKQDNRKRHKHNDDTGQKQIKEQKETTDKPDRQNADLAANNAPAIRMNASAPAAGKSDRPPKQAAIPDRELPASLASIYKQARGTEKAAEDAMMAEEPQKKLDKRLEMDTALPERFKKLQQQAFQGDARAQHDLAALYTAGNNGVEQDYDRAITLFRTAARQEIANARYNLGVLYHQGLGVDRDMQKAIRYYRAASLLGHAQARYNLGIAYIQGVGTKYNPRYAAAYFAKAARGGVVEAAYNLGLIYENGLAGKANSDLALFWYHHAGENGSKQAKKAIDQIAQRFDLSKADIQQAIKDIDLDVKIPADRDAAETQNQANPDETDEAMNLPGNVKPAFAPSNDPDLIVQIQRQLSGFDLYSGKADGDTGPKTRKAIKTYQEMHDLPQTGKSSEDLLVHMLSRRIKQ